MSRIGDLWRELSEAVNRPTPGEDILARRTTPPWESTDARVVAAWMALTAPENLESLLEWAKLNLNDYARASTNKAIEVCRSRRKNNGKQAAGPNSR
jgi:hypothetical protein